MKLKNKKEKIQLFPERGRRREGVGGGRCCCMFNYLKINFKNSTFYVHLELISRAKELLQMAVH